MQGGPFPLSCPVLFKDGQETVRERAPEVRRTLAEERAEAFRGLPQFDGILRFE